MSYKIDDYTRLRHIYDAIIEIESYIIGNEFETFIGNSMMRFACLKQIEIIGEASNYVTDDTKNRFAEIEWRKIVGLRNIIVHEYFGIDFEIIWQIIRDDLPELKQKVEHVLTQLS